MPDPRRVLPSTATALRVPGTGAVRFRVQLPAASSSASASRACRSAGTWTHGSPRR